MRRFVPSFVPRIAQHASAYLIVEILKYCVGLLFTASVFFSVSRVISAIVKLPNVKWILGVIFTSGGCWLYIAMIQKLNRRRPRFRPLEVDFELASCEITYQYLSATRMAYKKKKILRPIKRNLDVYRDKYRWTGMGSVVMKSLVKGQTVKDTDRKSLWQLYEIRFREPLQKREETVTEIEWELEDTGHTAVPFVSVSIEEPTDLLQFNVSFDAELNVDVLIGEESSHIGAGKPIRTERIRLDSTGFFRWTVPKPKLLHHYELKWDF